MEAGRARSPIMQAPNRRLAAGQARAACTGVAVWVRVMPAGVRQASQRLASKLLKLLQLLLLLLLLLLLMLRLA